MPDEIERLEFHWDAFVIYCENSGINLGHPDDYMLSWDMWKTAIHTERSSK